MYYREHTLPRRVPSGLLADAPFRGQERKLEINKRAFQRKHKLAGSLRNADVDFLEQGKGDASRKINVNANGQSRKNGATRLTGVTGDRGLNALVIGTCVQTIIDRPGNSYAVAGVDP